MGSDTVIGGSGNDIIFGGDLLVTVPGALAPLPSGTPDTALNSLVGGLGSDTVIGGSGNDIIFGSEGDDWLTGDAGIDLFEGGSGYDTVVETRDANFTITPTQLIIGGVAERLFDVERAMLSGGDSNNVLDAAASLAQSRS